MRRWVLAGALLLSGCDAANGVLAVVGGGPTITGAVKEMSGPNVRVGLLGSATAGGKLREIASTGAPSGSFALTLPARPPFDLMEQPAETRSIVFSLRAYEDRNGNGAYNDGETLCTCSSGQFRYFASDGPAGSYKAGWNAFTSDGRYTQSFQTAYVL